ncbi:MAG: LptE family protein [Desulfobaccales bacterium]
MAVCRLGVLALLLVNLWGCGYRPLGAAPPDPQVRPTLAIPLFANRSTEVGLEAVFANALINAFAQTGAVKVVPGDGNAELVLEGQVRSVDNASVAFDSVTKSTVRRLTLRVELTLRRKKGDKVLWKDTQILQEDYVVDPYYHLGEATRTEGVRRAAVNMARRVLDKVLLVI